MPRHVNALILIAVVSFIFSAHAAPVQWSQNGHYYELVRTNIDYHDALIEAAARTHLGWKGHLATLAISAENAFVTSALTTGGGTDFAWIAGREPADDGRWFWDAGPEAGIQFSTGTSATAPFFFANWGGIEPNDNKANEDYLMINIGTAFAGIGLGAWGDAAPDPNPTDPVIGYIVEYEPPTLSIRRSAAPNTVDLIVATHTNRSYQLQFMSEVTATNWTNFGSTIIGNNALATVPDAVGANTRRFYRLRIVP